jgi:copper chaperone CopZ
MTETLHVTGMTCGGCENAVRRAVGKLAGVTAVEASHAAERVEVTFDPSRVGLADITQQIERLGYRVR